MVLNDYFVWGGGEAEREGKNEMLSLNFWYKNHRADRNQRDGKKESSNEAF